MNNREENKYTMYQAVLAVIGQNQVTVDGNTVLKQLADSFRSQVENISSTNQRYLGGSQGQVERKQRLKDDLVDEANDLAAALRVYAKLNQKDDLRVFASITESSLNALRDTELAEKAKALVTELQSNQVELTTNYGVSADRITAFATLASDYESALGDAEASTAEKEAARKELTEAFVTADETLNEGLDGMLEVISKQDPDFYNAYKEARPIKNLGKRSEQQEEQPAV